MSQVLTLELPDDVYKAIERAAESTGQKPAEWVSMKLRQQLSAPRKGSPDAVLEAMHEPPHLTPADVETLEESIDAGKQPVKWEPVFDGEIEGRPERSAGGADNDERPIWEIIEEMNKELPPDTWNGVPTDGSINVDHYLYGALKRQP